MALFLAYWGRRTWKRTAKKANVFVSLGMTLALIAEEKKNHRGGDMSEETLAIIDK